MRCVSQVGPITFQVLESKSGKFFALAWDDDSMECVFHSEHCEKRSEAEKALSDFLFRSLSGQ